MGRRVVVTGMGAITPLGLDVNSYWQGLKSGKVAISTIESFDVSDFPIKLAAEVKDFEPADFMDKRAAKKMDRFSQLAVAASKEALESAGLDGNFDPKRIGVILGNGIGGIQTITSEHKKLLEKGPGRVSPFFVPMTIQNMASGNTAITYGLKGPALTIVTACAASTNAIGEAYKLIQDNRADIILGGGTEAAIDSFAIAGFNSMSALSTNEDPLRASIPFDKERSGFVMGEGAAILVLEELEHAKARGAKILGEVCGYGATCDAYHITSPEPEGEGAVEAMRLAIEDAGITPDEIAYINAHGTSTPYNDKIETLAIKKLFGEAAKEVSISSTKSMTGHLLGAAGAIEAVACVKAIEEGFVPPTMGYKVEDEECDLDYTINEGKSRDIRYAMSNSLGFGGHNASIIIKRWEE